MKTTKSKKHLQKDQTETSHGSNEKKFILQNAMSLTDIGFQRCHHQCSSHNNYLIKAMPENNPGAIFDIALHPAIINKEKGNITKNGQQNLSLNSTKIIHFVVMGDKEFILASSRREKREDRFISSALVLFDFVGKSLFQ